MGAISARTETHWILLCVFPDILMHLIVYIVMYTIHYIHVVKITEDIIIILNSKFLKDEYSS